ncbi:transcriptional regulator, HxlR family [Burkholderia cepacia]|nr:transcriptional regulator, HxlR family [Burkholderia cepacia]
MDLLVRMVPLWTWIVENADRFREARRSFDNQNRDANS